MTTTNVFQGMDLDKPSSKVLAPPGGKSNWGFGGDPEPQQQQQRPQQRRTEPTAPAPQQDVGPAKSCKPESTAGQTQSNLFGAGDPNNWPKPSSGKRHLADQNSSSAGFNLLSGEPLTPSQNGARRQQKDRVDPSNMPAAGSRIEDRKVIRKQPPGGASSFSFGN
ncbi:uncharacterized protein [Amphiura filiformis]|uniref:uncharacterized protein isoform X1 n=1 Tax=Amphiura filiformis TaxID=82378 RepID=UPI003B221FA1